MELDGWGEGAGDYDVVDCHGVDFLGSRGGELRRVTYGRKISR